MPVKYKEDKKYYEVRYDAGHDGEGKRIQKYKGGFKRKKDAEDYERDQRSSLKKGTYIEPQKILLHKYLQDWLDEQRPRLSPTTLQGYEINIRCHINPFIGGLRLQELRPKHIRKLYAELRSNRTVKVSGQMRSFEALSQTSVQYVHRVLSKALEDAYKDEIIFKNPAKLVSPPAKIKYEAGFLTTVEIRDMLEKFAGDDMYIPVMLAVMLGLRRGEILGLQWKDVDFKNNLIRIRNNYIMADGKPMLREKTKTDKSRREIVVTRRIMETLKGCKLQQKKLRMRIEDYHISDFVCTWQDGHPFNPSHLSRSFGLRMEKYKLPKVRFHDLRHSNAALMIKERVPTKGASDRLGHSTIQVHYDLYGHVEKSVQEQIAESIDKAIWGE